MSVYIHIHTHTRIYMCIYIDIYFSIKLNLHIHSMLFCLKHLNLDYLHSKVLILIPLSCDINTNLHSREKYIQELFMQIFYFILSAVLMKYHNTKNMNRVLEAIKTTLLSNAYIIPATLCPCFCGHLFSIWIYFW